MPPRVSTAHTAFPPTQTTYDKSGLVDPGYGEIYGFDHVHW